MGKIGTILKKSRESKGLTLQQIEDETNMRWKYLEALEEENYDVIPGQAYVRGFLRNYAAFLGIEPEEMLEIYRLETEINAPKEHEANPARKNQSKVNHNGKQMPITLLGIMLVGVIGVGSWFVWQNNLQPQSKSPVGQEKSITKPPAAEVPIAKPKPANETPNTPTQPQTQPPGAIAQGVALKLTASNGQCWIAVVADGQKVYEGFINNGEVKAYNAKTKIAIRYGNAGVVDVQFQGKDLGKVGGLGKVVNQEYKL